MIAKICHALRCNWPRVETDKEGKEGANSLQSTEMAFHLVSEGQGNPTVHPELLIPTQTVNILVPALVEASAAWGLSGEGMPLLQEHPPPFTSLYRETQTTYNDLKGPAAAWCDECI